MRGPQGPPDPWLHSQERINCLEGTHEFFEAIGFQKALLPVPDQGKRSGEWGGRAGSRVCPRRSDVLPPQRARKSSTC